MLAHKLVPKYMKELEMKSDITSYKRDENKCIASGQRALINFHRVLTSSPTVKYNSGTITFYILKHEDEEIVVKEKEFKYDGHARAAQRKKETSI